MALTLEDAEREAREFLAGRAMTALHALDVEKVLRSSRRFGLARKLLERTSTDPALVKDHVTHKKIAQKHALCTYKDPDLPSDAKLDDAEHILQGADDLQTSVDQETLGLAGAIFKLKWELTTQERYLEMSMSYYYRGYCEGLEKDAGYTAINAAFVLDLLADLEDVDARPVPLSEATSKHRRALAREIRQKIIAALEPLAAEPPPGEVLDLLEIRGGMHPSV